MKHRARTRLGEEHGVWPDRFPAAAVRRSARIARGFTLIELLVVVVIIGVLTAYVGPRYFGQVAKSEISATRAQIDAIEKALEQYRLDVGRYPTSEMGLGALLERPANEPKWEGPYLKKAVPN